MNFMMIGRIINKKYCALFAAEIIIIIYKLLQ